MHWSYRRSLPASVDTPLPRRYAAWMDIRHFTVLWRIGARIIVSVSVVLLSAMPAFAREQIRVVGSSTLYPFITLAAEQFGQMGVFKTPIVESTGTGGGFKLFCEGVGADTPDINDASRRITASEKTQCQNHGVTNIAEIMLGYDGIVIVSKKNNHLVPLTKKQLFLALARQLPGADGRLVANPYQNWREIDPALPNRPIEFYGSPPTEGTRDAFGELVMEKGCAQVPAFAAAYPDEKTRNMACRQMREDGKFIEAGGNYNLIVQKITADDQAFGYIGYGYYTQNSARVQASPVDGVLPTAQTIESGQYGVSRALYVYVKTQQLKLVPGIAAFLTELTSDSAIGPDGYVTAKGLLPLGDEQRKVVEKEVNYITGKIIKPPNNMQINN